MGLHSPRGVLIFVVGIFLCGIPAAGFGQEETATRLAQADSAAMVKIAEAPVAPGMISLDLRDMDIKEALKFLATKASLNIIPTQKVTGRVTLMVEDVPLQDVFDLMIRSNNLAYEKRGDIFNVMTEEEFKSYFGKNFSDSRQVRVFHLKYAVPEQVTAILENFKSAIGKVFVEPETGTVMVMDAPERMVEIEKALEALEQKTTIRIFDLKYAKAKDIEDQLKNQLDIKKVGTVKADERTNQILVQTLDDRMTDIERLIAGLDQKTKQVLIDARIIKVRMANDTQRGVEWEGLFNMAKKYGMAYLGSTPFAAVQSATDAFRTRTQVWNDVDQNVGSYPFSGTTSNYSSSVKKVGMESVHIGAVNSNDDFDVLIRYLQRIGHTKILSCPQIAVINNQEAKIHVGEKQAYVTTSTTAGQTTTTVSESVTYVDVGLQLFVTPTINDEGFVTMKIKPEISSVVDQIVSSSNNTIPIIDTVMAETSVMVKDGTTILIGGLNKEEQTRAYKGTPILDKIPLIKYLFSEEYTTKDRIELVILLTPHIITGDELTTGYDRDFQHKLDRDFEEYDPITQGGDLPSDRFSPKLYQAYPDIRKEEEDQFTIKPMRNA